MALKPPVDHVLFWIIVAIGAYIFALIAIGLERT
jgi:hypothetical protein